MYFFFKVTRLMGLNRIRTEATVQIVSVPNQIGTTNIMVKHHNSSSSSSQPTTNNSSNNRNKDNNLNSNISSPTLPVQVLSVFSKPRVEQQKKMTTKLTAKKNLTKNWKETKQKKKRGVKRRNLTVNRFLSLLHLLLRCLLCVCVLKLCAMCYVCI